MKVKKFYGVDNHDVITKVKSELGSNAVILHQRKVKPKGIFGFLKKSVVEVVAAIEENEIATTMTNITNMAKAQEINLRERATLKSKDKELQMEINDIKSMLGTVVNQMQSINLSKATDDLNSKKNSYIYNVLRENEIDEELINELLNNCDIDINDLELKDKETIKKILAQIIPTTINNNIDFNSKVIFFVGPTGVGKTTTIAKIAANYNLEKGLNVGLISADTYRIAAVEQLKVYSDILNIPLEVIYSPKEIHTALERLSNSDIIMIDTAGRSHKNSEHVDELALLLNEVKNKSVYLVISSTTKNSDLKDILKTYSFIEDYKIIFTKLDEVSTYGPILNIAMREPEYISYVTTGQSVPDDIEVVTSNKILDMLLKEI
ncbi:flagellar biosynthesis protein FlhF [Alkaliphilus sp. MSJ-5]|uniref:Flagellar biosynthesis protein FlhF n=1 Tax=Alkaliphilus flagellatus TaxID=2841507 RepID=A0ABS6G5I9_9FIRM|nr:flagellar biosynthesis protein FlhF [Alkaliphilus flagellatus]MBU5677434.1 flagellar biosynthesis protein FlhF [Alkaliphilus flagellatus]